MKKVRLHNDLSHPLFNNLREGNWLLDFLQNRLELISSSLLKNLTKKGLKETLDLEAYINLLKKYFY